LSCFLLSVTPIFCLSLVSSASFFFFFTAPPTTEIYTLSLHDALPISGGLLAAADLCGLLPLHWQPGAGACLFGLAGAGHRRAGGAGVGAGQPGDQQCAGSAAAVRHIAGHLAGRKSTRLNSSPASSSYAVFGFK